MDVRTGHVAVDGGRLYHERAGDGFPVVLIHPGLWDLRIWDGAFEAFAVHHDVIRYDLRGYGRSDPPTSPYSDLRDLRTLLERLGVERCALVGCSSGAQLALDAALAASSLVDAIVLISPSVSGYAWTDPGLDLLFAEIQLAVTDGELARAVDVELAVWTPLRSSPEVDERIRAIAMDNAHVLTVPDSLVEQPPAAIDRLDEVEAATLVLVGDKDVSEIKAIAELLVASIPGAGKRVIHDADHLVMVRQPEVVERVVLDFLSFRM